VADFSHQSLHALWHRVVYFRLCVYVYPSSFLVFRSSVLHHCRYWVVWFHPRCLHFLAQILLCVVLYSLLINLNQLSTCCLWGQIRDLHRDKLLSSSPSISANFESIPYIPTYLCPHPQPSPHNPIPDRPHLLWYFKWRSNQVHNSTSIIEITWSSILVQIKQSSLSYSCIVLLVLPDVAK